MRVTFTVRNDNPNTIHNRLKARLGREPSNAELRAEVSRILSEAERERAEQGKMRHQRR
jgi:hypothetical protein